jgi:PAS domain-containing protein
MEQFVGYAIAVFQFWDETGKIQRLVGFAEDITERKQVDEALSTSKERFRTAVETMLDCFGIYTSIRDESGQIQISSRISQSRCL